jgi:hypothetical protein
MRLGAVAMRLVNPAVARQIQAGIVLDVRPQAFDAMAIRLYREPSGTWRSMEARAPS